VIADDSCTRSVAVKVYANNNGTRLRHIRQGMLISLTSVRIPASDLDDIHDGDPDHIGDHGSGVLQQQQSRPPPNPNRSLLLVSSAWTDIITYDILSTRHQEEMSSLITWAATPNRLITACSYTSLYHWNIAYASVSTQLYHRDVTTITELPSICAALQWKETKSVIVHALLWSLLLPSSTTNVNDANNASVVTATTTANAAPSSTSSTSAPALSSSRGRVASKRRKTAATTDNAASSSTSSPTMSHSHSHSYHHDTEPASGTLASCWWWHERRVASLILSDLNRERSHTVDVWRRPYEHATWHGTHTLAYELSTKHASAPSSSSSSSSIPNAAAAPTAATPMDIPLCVTAIAQLCTPSRNESEYAAWRTLTTSVNNMLTNNDASPTTQATLQSTMDHHLQAATNHHVYGRLCSLHLYRVSATRVQCVINAIMTPS
jgi:hypothetical protein